MTQMTKGEKMNLKNKKCRLICLDIRRQNVIQLDVYLNMIVFFPQFLSAFVSN